MATAAPSAQRLLRVKKSNRLGRITPAPLASARDLLIHTWMTTLITSLRIPCLAILLVLGPGLAHAGATARADARPSRIAIETAPVRRAEIEKILAVLEREIADPVLRAKALDKLATLSDRQLRLLASLSEHVAAAGDGPAGGIALFLITALLILS